MDACTKIKLRQYNGCGNLKIIFNGTIHLWILVANATDSQGILANISQPLVWSVSLENLWLKGYSALTPNPSPLSIQGSGNSTSKHECAKQKGELIGKGKG